MNPYDSIVKEFYSSYINAMRNLGTNCKPLDYIFYRGLKALLEDNNTELYKCMDIMDAISNSNDYDKMEWRIL